MTAIPLHELAAVTGAGPDRALTIARWVSVGAVTALLGSGLKTEWDVEHGRGPAWAQKARQDRLDALSADAARRHPPPAP